MPTVSLMRHRLPFALARPEGHRVPQWQVAKLRFSPNPSVVEPEFPSHPILPHRFQVLSDLRHTLSDLRPQLSSIADRIRSCSGQQSARPLDLLL